MRPLLLTDYGLCLKTKERRLVLLNQDSGERKEWLPVDFPFDSIIVEHLGGFVTFPALRWLATNGVSLTALDFNGSVLGSWLPDYPINPHNRINQIAAYLNPTARLAIARFILEAKLGKPVPSAYRTWDDLLTFEGREANRFWADLGITRDYPSARDATNACLNYSFGLLASRARVAIHRLSLEPSVGFLHVPQNYKSALVYDTMEPFRSSTVKSALAVKRELNSRDFGEVFGHGLRLRPEGAHRLVQGFAKAFPEKEMGRFVERLALQCGVLGHVGPNHTEPQIGGQTAPPLFA
jgi:CRISPR/Cas system-associated endonuclease Cas1